jgi:hypothetical protein
VSQEEIKDGQRWVEDTLTRLLEERNMKLEAPIKWTANMDRKLYVMEARMNGSTICWNLAYEVLLVTELVVAHDRPSREICHCTIA